jgi:uncharacterized protein (UPF0212 family)
MKAPKYREPIDCPKCQAVLNAQDQQTARIDAGRYVCPCCSQLFTVPVGLRA